MKVRSWLNWSLLSCTLFLIGSARIATADPMSWSGASATVDVLGQSMSSSGANPQVSLANTAMITYGSILSSSPLVSSADGSASASVGGSPENLLSTSTRLVSSQAAGGDISASAIVDASANWSGDRVILAPTAGQAMPQSVRLNFSVDFALGNSPPSSHVANVTVTFNGQQATLYIGRSDEYYTTALSSNPSLLAPATIQNSPVPFSPPSYSEHATFSLDLPIHDGVSDPFQVGLKNAAIRDTQYSGGFLVGYPDVTLSLDGLTLADGNTPESEGYSVAFASGLASPNAVPEPATLAIFAAGIGAMASRRWRQAVGA